MSLLPGQIIPATDPIGRVDKEDPEGRVLIDKNWWLLLYNLCQQVLGLGTGQGLPASALQDLAAADTDAADSDAIALRRTIDNLKLQVFDDQLTTTDPALYKALLLAQEPLLPDPPALAQPVAAITPTGSVFTYTAPAWGVVVINGGAVTVIAIKRQGTSITTGLTDAVIPLARFDQVLVTYTVAPTMTFIPGSIQ
jgi:hypothetical protein